MDFFWRKLIIEEVIDEKEKSLNIKISFSANVGKYCHICGSVLDNEVSRAAGIGPTCAKKVGVQRPNKENTKVILKELEEVAKKLGVIGPVWISKRSIIKK